MFKRTLIFKNKKHYERFMDKMQSIKSNDAAPQNDFRKAYELADKIMNILVGAGHRECINLLPQYLQKLALEPNNNVLYGAMKGQLEEIDYLIKACVKSEPLLKQIKSIIK